VAAVYRSQNNGKVRMSTVPAAHQGLGVAQYIWASSPLRRYVDLLNQRQLIAWVRGEPPPYPPKSERLLTAMRDFEQVYEIYSEFQRSMERYWCLRWLIQESVAAATAEVIRESLVKITAIPLITKVHGLPELDRGAGPSRDLGRRSWSSPSAQVPRRVPARSDGGRCLRTINPRSRNRLSLRLFA
jgi:exoribonuclease-2